MIAYGAGPLGDREPLRHGPLAVGQHDGNGAQRSLGNLALNRVGQATTVTRRLVAEGGESAGSAADLRHLGDRIKSVACGRLSGDRGHQRHAQ